MGIFSILDLARADPVKIRDRFSVVVIRTVLELQGTPCIAMEEERIGRDQLIFSRSFAKPITTAHDLRQVLSVYGQQASARLAKHDLQAKVLTAYAVTSHFNPHEERRVVSLLKDVARPLRAWLDRPGHAGIRGGLDWTMKRDMLSPATPRTGTNSPWSKPPECTGPSPCMQQHPRRFAPFQDVHGLLFL